MKPELVIRSEKQPISNVYGYRNIIAGFPGVGKSTAAERYPDQFIDMESSNYHWITGEDGNKTCNPEWPMNYVNAIIEIINTPINQNSTQLYICTSTHAEVLKEFEKNHLYYMAVVPKSKDIYIQRYKNRGNDESFINLLNNKFNDFIKDIEASSAFGIYYTDGYLADIFVKDFATNTETSTKYDSINNSSPITIEINPNNFPEIYTDKIIVAVWPYTDAIISEIHNQSMFKYYAPDYLKTYIDETEDEDGNLIAEEYDNPNWAAEYVIFANIMANEKYINGAYTVIDGYPEVIEYLHRSKYNFILAIPESYSRACDICGNINLPTELSDERSFNNYKEYLKQFAFRTIITDQPFYIALCNSNGAIDQSSIMAIKHCAYKDTSILRSKHPSSSEYKWDTMEFISKGNGNCLEIYYSNPGILTLDQIKLLNKIRDELSDGIKDHIDVFIDNNK